MLVLVQASRTEEDLAEEVASHMRTVDGDESESEKKIANRRGVSMNVAHTCTAEFVCK